MISGPMVWNAKSMGFSLAGLTSMIYELTSIRVAAVCHTRVINVVFFFLFAVISGRRLRTAVTQFFDRLILYKE